MPETSQPLGSTPPAEHNTRVPDYFGFYTHEVAEFLSQDEVLLPFLPQNSDFEGKGSLTENCCTSTENRNVTGTASLFSDVMGAQLSDFGKERLRSLVRQSLFVFTREFHEILNPICQICRVRSLLRYKMLRHPGGTSEAGDEHYPPKKQKTLSGACGMGFRPEKGSPTETKSNGQLCLDADIGTFNEKEIDKDFLFLLDNDCAKVEEMTEKHSEELFAMIRNMEHKLEEFLDILMSKCRSMTLVEKQQLRKLIQELPPRHLNRVVEIIQRNKPINRYSRDEIYVDLEKENKVTLWRLYFYVEAIENDGKLSH